MADRGAEVMSLASYKALPERVDALHLHDDASLLKTARLMSVDTSPEAFLKTVADVDNQPDDYWLEELKNTWVAIQISKDIVGLAAAKKPHAVDDQGVDPLRARFIESVWIAEDFRRNGLATRLINFLISCEISEYPLVRRFLLWVIEDNKGAIALYERMGFKCLQETRKPLSGCPDRHEVQYQLDLPDDWQADGAGFRAAASRAEPGPGRLNYRMLGKDSS
jgi:ribosomal protein S18 acetylase RimI-like enzyme